MKLFQRILSNLGLLLVAMLLFLLFFQNKISLPPVIQAVGRMHPLLLHLPIGMVIVALLLWVFQKNIEQRSFEKIFTLVLHVAAFTSVLTALMGFFLSREGGYDETGLGRHKFFGIATAVFAYGLLWLYRLAPEKKSVFGSTLIITTALLVLGSHFGSNLTHGDGYVWQPLRSGEKVQEEKITDSSTLFAAAIRPILKSKCFSCHNEKRAKGELIMTTEEKLFAGGKNGPVLKAGDAINSHIIQKINLPEEDKKHMPPTGKPQLSSGEKDFLFAWIQSGADTQRKLFEYPENDSLKIAATKFIRLPQNETEEKKYPFAAASIAVIEKIRGPFCSVVPLSQNSPALQVNFFVREKYDPKKLEELTNIKEQIVELNLGNMPVTDPEMKTISKFTNLEKLILNNSFITNKGLIEIAKLKKLTLLSLAGTKIDKDAINIVSRFESLKEVFCWNTGITTAEIAAFQLKEKKIVFNPGYVPDKNEMLALTIPVLKNESAVISPEEAVELKHPIPGAVIRYTTDGTTPDSNSSPAYKNPININGFTVIKAVAVKDGWNSSPVTEIPVYKKGFTPNAAELINAPNRRYRGEGGKTLIDGKKGAPENFNDIAWLGYREDPFSALFYFQNPQPISSVSVSYDKSVQAYLMPPTEIEIWAGEEKNKLKLLKKINPPPTTKEELNAVKNEALKIELPPATAVHYYKIVAKNITKLPSWHPGKGEKGWVFIDEIFFN